MTDTADLVLGLLSAQWTSSNTDNLTPVFIKMTSAEYKRYDPREAEDVILAQPPQESQKAAGIGTSKKEKYCTVNLDIRYIDGGFSNNAHFMKVINEVIRIFDLNMVDSITGWQEVRIDDSNFQDLSDKRKGIWRRIIPVKLMNYNVARGS